MTKAYLNFPKKPVSYAPKMQSRRLALRNFITAAYKSDGEGGGEGGDDDPAADLLKKIGQQVNDELKKRNYQNKTEVEKAITTVLGGLDLEALRKFDTTKIAESVRTLAADIEKIKNRNAAQQERQFSGIRALVDRITDPKQMEILKRVFDSKTPGQVFEMSTRAAVSMDTGNVVPAEEIPEDILHSFSVDAFVPKRRPKEYIFDIASRRTVAKITEYKTWLEEGNEEGAFAIVAQGGLKPLMSKTLVRNYVKYRKAAGKRVYTEEFTKFRTEIYGILEDLFRDQVMRNYAAIITTDLVAAAAAYVGTTLDDQFEKPTDYHAIGAVAAQIESLEFAPDLLVINPQDKWRIGLQQGEDGHFFINIPIMSPSGVVQMLGFRVHTTTRIAAGEFILGESGLYKIEDEPLTIRMGYGINVTKDVNGKVTDVEHDFDHNRFRIIMETFFHNYISTNNTGSFVKGNFADIKAALLKPAI